MLAFWKTESTSAKLRAAYPPERARYLPSDNWMGDAGVAFPLYRLTGGTPHFGRLMRLGIPGLYAEVARHEAQAGAEGRDPTFYEAARMALDVFVDLCRHYAAQARSLAENTSDAARRGELLEMAAVLDRITVHRPRIFREALQLCWLYALAADVRNYGRMDVYLGDFLARDLDAGRLNEAEALRLLQSAWRLMDARHTIVANTLMGRSTAASADGRKAREPMNNGNAPSSGSDRKGLTAFLNSIVKPSPCLHAGAVQNMKFSRELFMAKRPQLEALLTTYFARGGAQAMITVVSRGDLERALIEPEQYAHVFVRVGGFSARFIDLPKDVQREILNRTLY